MNYLDIARCTLESIKVGAETPIVCSANAIPVTRSEQSADELLDELAWRGCLLGLDEVGRLVTDGVSPDMANDVTHHEAALTRILKIETANMAEAMDKIIDPPDPCQKCGSLELWESVTGDLFGLTPGRWRCLRCDPPAQTRRLRERADRLRRSPRRTQITTDDLQIR